MEVIPDQPFTILVSNFTNSSRRLPKHMKIAWAEHSLHYYVLLAETVLTEAYADTVSTVQRDEPRLSKLRSACLQSHIAQSQRESDQRRE